MRPKSEGGVVREGLCIAGSCCGCHRLGREFAANVKSKSEKGILETKRDRELHAEDH